MFQSDLFPAGEQLPSMPLAYAIGTRVAALLASGRHLTRTDISGLFAEETGVLDWGSAWTIDDYNSAVEIGALLWLRESSRIDLATNVHEAEARFDWLEAALPPRHVRSEAQVELQQFSTPPMLACLMAKAAAVCAEDTLLEPSAGNGALALWGCLQNASLLLNEIDPARRDGLAHVFPTATITAHDGELIADLLRGPVPSAVLMNPPFAHSLERGKDGETAMRHLRGAIRAAANRARIVAIMPEGFDASTFAKEQDEASLLLDVRLQQMFRRTGTGIAVRLVVFDKTPTASSPAITGDTADLISLHELITALPPRVQTSANIHRLPLGKPVRLVGNSSADRAPVRPVAPFAATPAATANAIDLAYSVLADPAPVPEQAGIYLPYRPSRIAFEDAPVHPTPLVESVAMGSVAAPQPDVCPRIPAFWQADALEATRVVDEDSGDTLNRNAKAAALSIFEGTKQRFFAQLLLSMKLPSLIPAMDAALGEDHSVVVQLVSTAEAMLDRRLADLSVEEREALDIDLSPREYVIDYLAKSFPVRLMQVFADDDGNLRSEAMSDEEGNPVFCPRAIAARDALIEQLCALPPIATALDAIIEHFGTEAVAEVTGRTRRLVSGRDGQQRLERRSPSANVAEAQSFMEGTKRILVFSDAGGTGRSYHADLGCRNQQRRVHFLLEPGWRADNAIQGLGRTNRTNQASAPLFRPVTTDVKGERRFISTIARRLDALGALTRGQRQTGGQNLFDPADNLESDYAREALSRWFQLLYDGKLEATSFGNFVERTGLRLESPDGGLTDNLPTIQRWLNRILALPIALQNAIFDEYLGLVEARIEAAREAGTLDQGLETVRVDRFTVLADELLRTDPVIGAETRLVSLEVTRHLRPLRLKRLVRMHEIGSSHAIPMRNARSGKVALSVPTRRLITDDGAVIERRRLLRPLNSANWTIEALAESHWEEIGVTAFTRAWRAEEERAAKSPVTERVDLATGLLLPVWKRLPGDHVRVTRLVAEDGQSIIGREVLDIDLAAIAETFGLSGVTGPAPDQIGDLVLASGKPLGLASHDPLTVKRSLVGGEQRLELTGFSPDRLDWYKNKGCFTEIIRYRTRLFVPTPRASETLQSIAIKS